MKRTTRARLLTALLPAVTLVAFVALASAMLGAPLGSQQPGAAGKTVSASMGYTEERAPGSRNVIAMIPGSDPALRGQYVAIGAHSDHVGFGEPVDHDSLWAFNHVVRPGGAEDGNKQATASDWPRIRAKPASR